ncbi:efflux RND transporter periplasmic adaptor subunit [Methylocapsa palsarum]|uniref:Membrane fusion protein, macrolide-specific efflux system n=1 Tax=Methylocapsa palsarum TaxID=1612308 RepID=A0A1I4CNC1_9HYPH|nr:efflux RND transporter periplasmic adaptor subunit [Methylocapsa palsarum]SFK82748.1 membrane fusion protein, macrolide-specific efflux system [Methylocapsa palsarum]
MRISNISGLSNTGFLRAAARARWIVIGVICLAAGYFFLRWYSAPAPPHYLTAAAARLTLESSVLATGTLQAIRQVDVGTRATGQLKSLRVKLGDQVRAGDLLAEIDPVLQENELRSAQAALANLESQRRAASARLRRSKFEFERQKAMIGGAATSRRELENADAQLESEDAGLAALDAQIKQANVQIDIAAANLSYTKITAPMDGEVVAILTQEGQTVVAAQIVPVILKLAELGAVTVRTQVSEADVIHVHAGQPASFTIMGDPDTHYAGKLRAVEPAPQNFSEPVSASGGSGQGGASPGGSNAVFYNALFDVANPDHRLRIGMTAQVSIQLGDSRDALAIPSAALRNKDAGGRYEVRVLGPQGKIETKRVRVGLDNYIQAEILDGLSEGETVITGEPEPAAAGAR